MGEYHDLYLISDILLLTDYLKISERRVCNTTNQTHACLYFTSPGLSWDAMVNMTDIKLGLMVDIDRYQFIEKCMGGGIS